MPATLYAISFQPTASVLAVCSFEKQNLADAAAWQQLRDALVGDALPINLGAAPKFKVPASFLAVDAIPTVLPSDDVVLNPYLHQVSLLSPTDAVVPGDGKDKILKSTGADNIDNSGGAGITHDDAAKTITIKFTTVPSVAWLVYESELPVKGDIATKTVTFTFGSSVSLSGADKEYLLFTSSAQVKVRQL
jgi:hypothetical protein